MGPEQSALIDAGQDEPWSRHVVKEQCLLRGMDAPPTRGSENLGSLGRVWVDLFTSEDNFHCPVFLAKSTDALAHKWPSLPLYAFPPVALLPQVLFSTPWTNGCAVSLRDYKKASVQKKEFSNTMSSTQYSFHISGNRGYRVRFNG